MVKKRREETKHRNIRLPVRLWNLLQTAADDRDVYLNNLMWRLSEEFLVKQGYRNRKDRKRGSVRTEGTMEISDTARLARLRRKATRLELRLEKSRVRNAHLDDFGLYWLIDPVLNAVIFAPRHDATLDDIEDWLSEAEQVAEP